MMNLKCLLSDNFVKFSREMGEIHKSIKEFSSRYQTSVKTLRENAEVLCGDLETLTGKNDPQSDVNCYLSDDFAKLSSEIVEIHQDIKKLTSEFQTQVKILRDKADLLRVNFENWEKEQESGKSQKSEEPKTAEKEVEVVSKRSDSNNQKEKNNV